MSSGSSGTSNSAVHGSLGVARVWSARGDWYIELESLSETLTCKILLIEGKEPMEQNTKRPRVVGSTEEGVEAIAQKLVIGADFMGMKAAFSELETAEQEYIVEAEMSDKTAVAPEI